MKKVVEKVQRSRWAGRNTCAPSSLRRRLERAARGIEGYPEQHPHDKISRVRLARIAELLSGAR